MQTLRKLPRARPNKNANTIPKVGCNSSPHPHLYPPLAGLPSPIQEEVW
jgi:hypothetical protein